MQRTLIPMLMFANCAKSPLSVLPLRVDREWVVQSVACGAPFRLNGIAASEQQT